MRKKYEMETGKAKRSVGCLGVKAVVNSFTRSYSFIVSFTSRFLSGFVVFGNESLLHAVGWLCGRDRNVTDSTVLRNMLARNVRYLPATKAQRKSLPAFRKPRAIFQFRALVNSAWNSGSVVIGRR